MNPLDYRDAEQDRSFSLNQQKLSCCLYGRVVLSKSNSKNGAGYFFG